jgi:hypothetical protein
VSQKILIRQVFDRCVIVRGRQEGLSCIPHLPYPWETLEGALRKRFFTFLKNSSKRLWETPIVTGGRRPGDNKKFESIRINLRDLALSQVCPRDPGLFQPWIPGTSPGTSPGIPSKSPCMRNQHRWCVIVWISERASEVC